MAVERVRQMSVEEFLDFAEQSEERYEFIDGELVPMTGGKLNHFRIIKRLVALLENRLMSTDCEALPNGMIVKAGGENLVAPDVIVVCGEPVTESDTRVLLNPILVAEVTSPSSIDYDRVVKRDFYESVDSIQAYLVIDQHRVLVELYTRSETGWHLQSFNDLGDAVLLAALDCQLPLRDIYRSIAFESTSASNQGRGRPV